MTERILVTGGAGFIGSNLVRRLRATRPDAELVVVDVLTYAGNLKNLEPFVAEGSVTFVRADIADAEAMQNLFASRKFDWVFHLAAESHVDRSILGPSAFVRTNVLGTQCLLEAHRQNGSGRFIHVSTDEVYGSLGPEGLFHETTPLEPTSPYAASKAASDLIALSYAKTFETDVVVTRCTNNYGPFQFPEKFIPLFIIHGMERKKLPLYGDGRNVRSWVHVQDHCEGLILVAERGTHGSVYNIGGDESAERENIEVAKSILSHLDVQEELIEFVTDRMAHDRRYAVDFSKVHKHTGWTPTVSFEQGLRETVAWYQAHEDWWREILAGEYQSYFDLQYGRSRSAHKKK